MQTNTTSYGELSEVARPGLARYDAELQSVLEPAENGRAVALRVDTGFMSSRTHCPKRGGK